MNENSLFLERVSDNGTQTIGRMYVVDHQGGSVANYPSMELPWKNNQRRISCIPPGKYPVVKHHSPTFGKCFWVQDVPGRSEILIHVGNYHKDTLGCILPGMDLQELNGDKNIDVTSSRKAVAELLELLPDSFVLEIRNGPYLND